MDVDLIDGNTHDMTLYVAGWLAQQESEQIQISNAATGAVLDTETLSNIEGTAVYLEWMVTGKLAITVTNLAGSRAQVSGLFFDPSTTVPAAPDLERLQPIDY